MTSDVDMPEWRRVFRVGLLPVLSRAHLEALRDALESGTPKLIQGNTTSPPPLSCVADWPVEAACALGYCAWKGDGLETVAEVEEAFGRFCYAIDERLNEPAGCRHFLNAYDDWPRDRMRAELLPEILRGLALLDAAGPEKVTT